MNTAELKIDLINQITSITDTARLKEVLQMLRFQIDKSVYITDNEEKEAIYEARKQISNGEVISNNLLQKEISEWLKK